jgi:deaminated glutathione amidase
MPLAAALQMTSSTDVGRNLAAARSLLEQAARAGAVLAVLPENFALMAASEARRVELAEAPGDGPIQAAVAAAASQLGLWIVAGTVPLRTGRPDRSAPASLVFDARGVLVARYDKIHLFDVDLPGRRERYRESATTAAGRDPVVVDSPVGRLGLSVCYDVRFPELYRRLSAAGAEVLTVPSAFTAPTGRVHWEVLLRARAIENQCYVLAAAQSGLHENGRQTYGDTLIIDPWGTVVRRLPRGSGIVLAEIDRARILAIRKAFPVLDHRQMEG